MGKALAGEEVYHHYCKHLVESTKFPKPLLAQNMRRDIQVEADTINQDTGTICSVVVY